MFFAGVAGWAGWLAVVRAYANALPPETVSYAYFLAADDSRIAGRYAKSVIVPGATASERLRAANIARAALHTDPLAEDAVVALGTNALFNSQPDRARYLFDFAQRLSRRNLQVQIWAIEDAVQRGDVASAVRHYDIALRTKPSASDLFYPVLASAIDDATVRAELVNTLARRPFWAGSFLDYAASHAPNPEATTSLYRAMRGRGVAISNGQNGAVLNQLLAAGKADIAWAYYAEIHPGVDRQRSRDPMFRADLDVPSAFDWVPVQDNGVVTSMQKSSRGGLFDFYVGTAQGGLLLRQVQLLEPGDYILEGHSLAIDQPAGSGPFWALLCGQDRILGRVDVPNSSVDGGRFFGRLKVPSDCPVQTLTLQARPSDAVAGASGQIDRALLRPAP